MTSPQRRLLHAANRLALRPVLIARARITSKCAFCGCEIAPGVEYRNAGTLKAHEICFQALVGESKHWR
jgi:hypothetical protein